MTAAKYPRNVNRSGDMCRCGHVRDGHFYMRRSKFWGACKRHIGAKNTPWCDCKCFTPKG